MTSVRETEVRKDSRLFAEMCGVLLKLGHQVKFQAEGQSMRPNLQDGDNVLVTPAGAGEIHRGDIVLAENADGLRVHRVSSCDPGAEELVLRSDTGHDFDPSSTRVFGKVLARARGSQELPLTRFQIRFIHPLRILARRVARAAQKRLRRFALLSLALVGATFFVPGVHAQTADLQLTQTASAPAVATGTTTQTLGTAATATWAGGIASFTFPTPLPVNAVPTALLTTTGFTPAGYNVTNATILTVNSATGVITVALPAQPLGTATTATWAGGTASFTFPTPLPTTAATGDLLTTAGFTPGGYNVTNAVITSVNNVTGVVTVALAGQTLGTATAATWTGGVASFTFPTPLPANAVTGSLLTTTGFTPAAYNVTNATITSVNAGTGVITVALASQSLGTATAATWAGGVTSYTFPTPLPANVVTGALLTTAGFAPGGYNGANVVITSVNNLTGVVTVAHAGNPGASTTRGTGTAGPGAATVSGTGTANPGTSTANGSGTSNPGTVTVSGTGSATMGFVYTEVVTNNSSSAIVPTGTITVYMQTPANTSFEAYAGTNWTCTTPTAGGTGPIICTYNATLASGATATSLIVNFQINAGTAAGTTIQGSASVTNSTFVDTVPNNNTSITSIVVEPTASADLGVSTSVAPTPVFVSSNFTYSITVQNLGQASAPVSSNVLTDTLPATVTFNSIVTPAGWSCSTPAVGATGTISCSITAAMKAAPAAGSTATFAITVSAPTTAITLNNTATVSLSGDPNSANNSATSYTVVQPLVCASPGRDGAGGTLTGIVNAYYPPSTAGTLAANSTSVSLGAAASGGAQTAIAAGDLLLIIQMQGATINSSNTSSYGDGLPGDPGSGSTSLGSSGLFEFVTATNAVGTAGGTLTFTGTGPNSGLLNSYSYVVATTTQPQQTYQVIRVPQYTSASIGVGLVPLAWNGSAGGVLAIDVSSQLTLAGTVALDALGFRGGGGQLLSGAAGALTDYVTAAPANNTTVTGTNGSKGEGIAGTPRFLAPATIITTSTPIDTTGGTPADTLPGGSYARGAPGNAGGGATDGHPAGNDFNSGGGAGGNGGNGGQGGYGWNSMAATNSTDGGFGGVAFPASTSALVMGGGGGAGTTNNGTYFISNANNGNGNGIFSSGGAGGAIAIIHTGSVTGTGTITSNGESSLSTLNDGTGGGGAGGSILLLANSGGLGGLTVTAVGGNAGNAWPNQAPGGFPGERHGPGGGGGGGVIFLSAAPASSNVAGGNNGNTDTVQDSYGATPGLAGVVATAHVITETPGTQPGAYCAAADLSVTNSGLPLVVAPGGTITYTQSAKNNGPLDAVNAIFSEAIPANTTFLSITPAAGWTCVTPAVGSTGNITCTLADFAASTTANFVVGVTVGGGTASGTQIVDVDNITSGTSDPNLANNSATVITTVGIATSADLAVTNTASAPTVTAGSTVTMTGVVTNNGPASASNATFTEAIPSNTTFASLATPAGWNCNPLPPVNGTGTIYCTATSAVLAGAIANFPLVLNVPAATPPGTVITAQDVVAASTPDSNTGNNTAVASTVVAGVGQVDLAVTATGTPNLVYQGNNISYTQMVTNNGPITETNATFKDTIPTGTTLVSFTPPANWTCNTIVFGGTGTFTCTLNGGQTILAGASVSFPLVVKVNTTPNLSGTQITNTPSVSSTIGDPNPANNSVTVSTTVVNPTQADVSIVKTAAPEPVDQGTNLAYSLMVTNGGPAVAQGVNVSDTLPSQVSYLSSSASQGSCTYTVATTTVACSLGSLSVGSSASVTINVTANTFSSASLTSNTATVTTTTTDPNLANNTSTATSTVQTPTAVDIAAFHASAQSDGSVILEWRTQEESRNLGFHIYREQSGGRQRITPSLIAGSALLLRGSQPQHAAKVYRWIDEQPTAGSAYWIEDVDINGTRTMHGPASVENATTESVATMSAATKNVSAKVQASPLLRELHAAAAMGQNNDRPLMTPRPLPPALPPGTPPVSVADHNAVKIAVDHEGWYHISFADLIAAGLDRNSDVRSLHLFAEGIEQPLLITNDEKGMVLPSDGIEFYGTGIDTPFSADRIYWLVRENTPGKRIPLEASSNSGNGSPNSFPFTVVREDRFTYFAALLNGENNDNFFGAIVTSDPVDQDLEVAHFDTSSALPITLDLTLQGANDGQPHSINVQMNGSMIGQMNFTGQILNSQTFNVESSLVHDGSNTVTLTALDGDNDVSVVQSIQLHYAHTYAADGNWLRATAAPGSELHISGFSDAQVRVFDITDPLNISEIGGKISANAGLYEITSVVPGRGSAERTLLAFSGRAISGPVSLTHHVPSFLDDQRAGADVVIISNPDFAGTLAPLVQLRESQNHRVLLATTDEVYDEYNYGERSPFAIRNFLKDAAARWHLKPQAILLVGDASFDPRDYLGLGAFDFVPTRMIETAAFKTSSDDWFTDFQSTGYATIPTGRLPVRTVADTQLLVSKIVNYERGTEAGPWNGQALLIGDQNVNSNFSAAVLSSTAILPKSLQVSEILADGQDTATVHAQLLAALNNGSLIVDYQGHGAEQQWSFTDFFSGDDANTLTNGGKLPVYIMMDCLNGFFQDVYGESLAESVLLSPNGGGVAVWASSGFTEQAPQASMNQALLAQLATHPNEPLGQLILQAKSGTTDNDVRRTWILFGDPAMKLHFLTSPSPANSSRPTSKPVIPREMKPVCELGPRCVKGKLQE